MQKRLCVCILIAMACYGAFLFSYSQTVAIKKQMPFSFQKRNIEIFKEHYFNYCILYGKPPKSVDEFAEYYKLKKIDYDVMEIYWGVNCSSVINDKANIVARTKGSLDGMIHILYSDGTITSISESR